MLNYKQSQFFETNPFDILPGLALNEEGYALVYVKEDGKTYVSTSTGVEGETFAGLNMSVNLPPSRATMVEEHVIPTGGKISLNRVPVTGQLLVKVAGTKATISAGTSAGDAGTATVNGKDVFFNTADVGKSVFVQYHYELLASEAKQFTGDHLGGVNTASAEFGSTGVVQRGTIETSMFDASVDWTSVVHPKLGQNGMFTVGGNGTLLTNVVVLGSPSAESSFLRLEIRA
jgi:hypothetical protein